MAKKTFLMKKRPSGMDYATYRASCAAKGMNPMDADAFKALPIDGEEGDEGVGDDGGDDGAGDDGGDDGGYDGDDGDDGDDGEDIERGTPLGDMLKALSDAGSVTEAIDDDGPGREDYLTARFQNGVISKSEQRELARIWSGDNPVREDQPLRKSLTEILDDDDARVVDASPILTAMFNGLDESLGGIRTDIAKSVRQQRALSETHISLTKAMIPVVADLERKLSKSMDVIDALGTRLNILERQPRQRRSRTTSTGQDRPIAKSTSAGGTGRERSDGRLTKAQVVGGLNALTKSARENGDTNLSQRLVMATAAYESTGILDPGFASAVRTLY